VSIFFRVLFAGSSAGDVCTILRTSRVFLKRLHTPLRMADSATATAVTASPNFVADIIDEDIRAGKHQVGKIVTRFPPEPNGYLHLGHAKSICLNFGLGRRYNGRTHLRFDDTNPAKEETEYVDSIQEDVRWLGGDWGAHLYYASDYFDKLYEWAVHLVKTGKAYVDDQTLTEIREHRGSVTEPGTNSPFRDRTPEENLALFQRMKNGDFPDGHCVLRAKIDMAHANMNLRDPVLYRIQKAHHHRTGDKWCIYPMYDYAHGQSDAIEGITHSVCTLEFELHRPLYEWFLEHLPVPCKPRQIEFARLNLTYTLMSKRKLLELVQKKIVRGWDDPRMPTLSGMRRRGFTPEALINFCERIGVTKRESTVELEVLTNCQEEHLQVICPRRLVVLDPLPVTITNLDADVEFEVDGRSLTLGREILIEREDFQEDADPKFFRLKPGGEVRLRHTCILRCTGITKNKDGNITCLEATWDPESKGGNAPDGRKVKGTIHWVSAKHAVPLEARLYENLFLKPTPEGLDDVNPESLKIITAHAEASLKNSKPGERFQFERKGYFTCDYDSAPGALVFNRTLALKDSYAKETAAPAEKRLGKKEQQAQKKDTEEEEGTPFSQCLFKVGKIVRCEPLAGSEKLYVEEIDLGEAAPRTIVSGLRKHVPLEEMQGRLVVVIANIEKKKLAGVASDGMVMCAKLGEGDAECVELIDPPKGSIVGERVTCKGHEGPAAELLKGKHVKKTFLPVLEDLNTSDACVARYKDLEWTTSAGVCTCKSIKGGGIS